MATLKQINIQLLKEKNELEKQITKLTKQRDYWMKSAYKHEEANISQNYYGREFWLYARIEEACRIFPGENKKAQLERRAAKMRKRILAKYKKCALNYGY